MALQLEKLIFDVNTDKLQAAQKEVENLAKTVQDFNRTKAASDRESAKAAKEAEKAARDAEKATKAAAKAQEEAAKKTDENTKSQAKLDSLIERLNNNFKDLAAGFTKGESGILNQARAAGAFEKSLEPVIDLLEKIKQFSNNPFDASLGSLRSITQEFEAMATRAELANKQIFLTSKQLMEYSRLSREAAGKVISSGMSLETPEGMQEYNRLLTESRSKYLEIAVAVNSAKEA